MKKEYYFKEGCYIEEWLNSPDDETMSIAKVRVLANTQTKNHALKNTTERYVILSGQGNVSVGDKQWPVKQGDVVTIKPDQTQSIINTGSEDLVFVAICTPRFVEHNYYQLASK
ncbi:MAG: cupin domain-containing protein [Acidiferrobacterales bacterium]|nr:cupin domain-containing protein [Acidiferrobacterales bacterium]